MKTILLTENKFKKLFLTENKESKNISLARKYIKNNGYNLEEANKLLIQIRNDIPNSRLVSCKFLLGVTRLFLDGELNNHDSISKLNKTLKYIASDAHVNEYDNNLNDESCETLIERFALSIKSDLNQDKENLNKEKFIKNTNYIIKQINTFEESEQYGKYTEWCITHYEEMYNSYSNDGFKPFYFCLRKGFENIPKKQGENCPLDEYGLSMIAISVNEDGSLNTCTCRWNHDNNGSDNILDTKQISQLLGTNFYDTFKPYSQEYINEKKQERLKYFENALQKLIQGENIKNVFQYRDQLTPYMYFVSQDFTSEIGALIIRENASQYQYVRNENNQIILFKNAFLINDYIISYQTENSKSGLMKIPEFKTIATFPDETNAYGINIPQYSDFYNKIFYLAYQNGKIQFVNITTNQKSELMDYPMNIKFIENNNQIKLHFLNHNTQYLDANTLELTDNEDNTTVVKSFFINDYFISIVKIDDEYNLLNTKNNQLIFDQNVKNINLLYNLNIIITEPYSNAFTFYKLNTFDGNEFQPFFIRNVKEYKVDEYNQNIFYIKLDIGIQFKYDFINNKIIPIQNFE